MENLVLRPIQPSDLANLLTAAQAVGSGFTSLPNNEAYLAKRIQLSTDSFAAKIDRHASLYLMVLEDLATNSFAGLCGIEAMVGFEEAFYNYKISTITQTSKSLDKYLEHKVLQVVNDFQGASEVVSLYLHPEYRGERRGELLSRGRFVLVAQNPQWFSDTMIAEIRGMSDEHGHAPFWDSLGAPFFDMTFLEADYLTTIEGKQFISDLVPKYPVYQRMLSQASQDVIGIPHVEAARAKQMLEEEGFIFDGYIDIFDGGPLLHAPTSQIKTVQACQKTTVARVEKILQQPKKVMICNQHRENFRLMVTEVDLSKDNQVIINSTDAEKLKLRPQQQVCFCDF